MLDRIRAIRQQKGMTLADVAAACSPPTTAQTIGRLETGARTLSLDWMNRIAAALGVEAGSLLRAEAASPARMIASHGPTGLRPLRAPHDVLPHSEIDPLARWVVLGIEVAASDYRAGDQVWMRHLDAGALAAATSHLINREALVPLPGGRVSFGRIVSISTDEERSLVTLLPSLVRRPPLRIEDPEWIALAETLVRAL
ncbi:helix-turn-helix domain-containing protein [Novosphingobium sp. MBES04]|uniref:helix-turn-helix domain-containing protein n=1 Tax=Novosphingobium sp. MBES04 TaxID=1206458 RepID=UPI00057F3CEF|nr:helix-turn-helix transcriptional regulator [Novosphingobium sp. MBES04]GAM07302.1 XRE family transcriptional regulator [Novosphingobium sp. MBES04]